MDLALALVEEMAVVVDSRISWQEDNQRPNKSLFEF